MIQDDIESDVWLFWRKDIQVNIADMQNPALPVLFPNEPFVNPVNPDDPFQQPEKQLWLEVLYFTSNQSETIAKGTYRKSGIVTFNIHVPLGTGITSANALAKVIIDKYQGLQVLDQLIMVDSCSSLGAGFPNGDKWTKQVDAQFRFLTAKLGEAI